MKTLAKQGTKYLKPLFTDSRNLHSSRQAENNLVRNSRMILFIAGTACSPNTICSTFTRSSRHNPAGHDLTSISILLIN